MIAKLSPNVANMRRLRYARAMLDADEITRLLTHADGGFRIARWKRPIAPVVFGVDDATVQVFRAAINAVVELAQHPIEDIDAEQGAI